MECGNCGHTNKSSARICARCGATLALTDYFHPAGFVEKRPLRELMSAKPEKKEPVPDREKKRSAPPSPASPRPRREGKTKEAPKQPPKPRAEKKSPAPEKKTPAQQPEKKAAKVVEGKPSKPAAYNKITAKLTMAEKVVKKKTEKKHRAIWLVPLFLLLLILAVGMFIGKVMFYQGPERYTELAERFVQAVATGDTDSISDCVHSKMYGTLRARQYPNVSSCTAKAESYTELDYGETAAQLQQRYEIEEPVIGLYRVHVSYTVFTDSRSYPCSMDVLVANIGGEVYAINTENINDSAFDEPQT